MPVKLSPSNDLPFQVSDEVDVIVLSSSSAVSYSTPKNYRYLGISVDGQVRIRVGGAAAVESSNVTDGTGSIALDAAAGIYYFRNPYPQAISIIRTGTSTVRVSIQRFV